MFKPQGLAPDSDRLARRRLSDGGSVHTYVTNSVKVATGPGGSKTSKTGSVAQVVRAHP